MEVGDLVCLHRRKHKGVGIVLRRSLLSPHQMRLIKEAKSLDGMKWKEKERLQQKALLTTKDVELIEAAFLYNLWQRNAALKEEFVYIKWFQRPSEYVQTKTSTDADWFPLDWVARIH